MSNLPLARPLMTRHSRLPREVRTVDDAIAMIEDDIPKDSIGKAHWLSARDQLHAARETELPRDIERATTRLEAALQHEGWLH
ncbi:MAG: hypothetical protein E6J90_29110 [Deltaproteobacteria bacterium]|nr:MAG: hypothetical protein E6J90_29110 [Deltaproteobacteria bacterium]